MNVDDLLRCLVVLTQPCAVDRMVKLKLQSNIVFDPLPKKKKKMWIYVMMAALVQPLAADWAQSTN